MTRGLVLIAALAGLGLLALANWQFVTLAIATHPGCVRPTADKPAASEAC